MQAVIMAAGKSTRTYPLTLTRPKPLLKIANRTLLEHQLDALTGVVDEVVIVVGYLQEMIRARYGDAYGTLRLRYVEQVDQLGTGHAILKCKDAISGPFIAMNGDDLYASTDLKRLASERQGALVKPTEDARLYGVYEVDPEMRAIRIVEKPRDAGPGLVNVGAYKFEPSVFDILGKTPKSERGEIEITSAIQVLADERVFRVVEMEGHWFPIVYPWSLLDANEFLLEKFLHHEILGEVSPAAHINGRVYVAPGAVIRSGVVMDGPVYVGPNASVGPNCWIRPCSTIGNECKVGHAVEIKNSILMDGAAVPHLSYVGDSVLGERTNFGAGTITANFRHDAATISSMVNDKSVDSGRIKLGVIAGDDVHTGIHTSIFPGRKLWPHTFTFPGECIRKDVTEIRRLPQK